jgi:hypothetical protein
MRNRLDQAQQRAFVDETILHPASDTRDRPKVCCPKREVVAGSGPHLTKELIIFGLPVAFFLILQYRVTMEDAGQGVMPPPLPFWLLLIFLRCLAKDPEDRFQDVDRLEQALAQCAAADQWTQWRAAGWWHENDRTATASLETSVLAIA